MNNFELPKRLQLASESAINIARKYVTNNLPSKLSYYLYNECERVFLHKDLELYDSKQALEALCYNDQFPRWVDVAVFLENNNSTVLSLVYSMDKISSVDESIWRNTSIAPFRCKSPTFPPKWKDTDPKFQLPYA